MRAPPLREAAHPARSPCKSSHRTRTSRDVVEHPERWSLAIDTSPRALYYPPRSAPKNFSWRSPAKVASSLEFPRIGWFHRRTVKFFGDVLG